MEGVYALSWFQKPLRLYRVQHRSSATARTFNGLEAQDQNLQNCKRHPVEFCESLVIHLEGSFQEQSTYIPCFADKERAEDWAIDKARSSRRGKWDPWSLLTVNPHLVPGMRVLYPKDLFDELKFTKRRPSEEDMEGVYLCLHKIPEIAIIGETCPLNVKLAVDNRKWKETYLPSEESGNDEE